MISLEIAWRLCKRWVVPESDPAGAPSLSSSRAYMREWHRRQREAIRAALDAEKEKTVD
jgi:hypothetical protein